MRRRVFVVAVLAAAALAPAATAGPIVDRAVHALQSDPVYVDPSAEKAIGAANAQELRRTIDSANAGPVYIAILPSSAEGEEGGDPDGVLQAIGAGLDRDGTVALIVGNHFRAGSRGALKPGVAGQLAHDSIASHGQDGVTRTLLDFVGRVAGARANGGRSADRSPGSGGFSLIGVLAVLGGAFLFLHTFRRRREERRQLAEVKAAAKDDLVALADDVQKLEQGVDAPGAPAEAKQDYQSALDSYDKANRAFDHARRPQDVSAVTEALEEGRYRMASADALLHAKTPPERRPPCFFDPRHGPSTRDVEWAPPGGAARQVPACEADALAVERGRDPATREVMVGGRATPYYAAPAYFSPWAGGYFGGFGGGGFLPGLFVGELLGGGFGGFGGGFGGYGGWGGYDGGGGGGGGSDFGGGMDFGGGDFGGGGGGDF